MVNSRQYKFRAWVIRKRKPSFMVNSNLFSTVGIKDNKLVGKHSPNVIIMQYTGLKDKNGKEIYGGDLISNISADVNEVYFYEGCWCYSNYHAAALPLYEHDEDHEVIGNIYENPELKKLFI